MKRKNIAFPRLLLRHHSRISFREQTIRVKTTSLLEITRIGRSTSSLDGEEKKKKKEEEGKRRPCFIVRSFVRRARRVVVKISRNARKSPGRWLNGALSIQSGDTWSPYLGFVGWIDKSRPTTLLGREWRGERVGKRSWEGERRWTDDGDARKRGVENGSR